MNVRMIMKYHTSRLSVKVVRIFVIEISTTAASRSRSAATSARLRLTGESNNQTS